MSGRRGKGEGSIRRRKDGRWEGRYTEYSGGRKRRVSLYGATREEVVRKMAERLVFMGRRPAGEDVSVEEFLARWLSAIRRSVRETTYRRYETNVRVHLLPAFGHLRLSELHPLAIQQFYARKMGELSPRTVRYLHATLGRALRMAVRWGMLERSPTDLVDPPKAGRREQRFLTPEQAVRLIECSRGDRLHALYVLALTTGMRQGELLGLMWQDWEGERIFVRRTLINCGGRLWYGEPKTQGSRRGLYLPPLAVQALARHRSRMEGEGNYGPQRPIFCNRKGAPLLSQNLMRRSFHPLLERAGLPRVRFHDLRHTFASFLIHQGLHPKVVSDALGHSSIKLTMDTYSHLLPGMQRQASIAISQILRESRAEERPG